MHQKNINAPKKRSGARKSSRFKQRSSLSKNGCKVFINDVQKTSP